jgi:all-trans-retinol 13,14-reductase
MEHEIHYQPLGKSDLTGPWDVIVVGSGMGGMACAASLAKHGRRCLVLEQHYVPGGFTHTFSRKGYTWDVGVHCVGEMGPRDIPGHLLRWLTDGSLEWQWMGEQYEHFTFPGGFEIGFPSNPAGFRQALVEKFPDEVESIDAYFATIRDAIVEAKPFFAARALPSWLGSLGFRALRAVRRRDYWKATTAEVLRGIVPNPRLRAVLCGQWGYYGSTPEHSCFMIHAMTVVHFLKGGYYPVGTAASIGEGLLRTVKNAGGAAVVRAPVAEILVEGGRARGVKLADGREILAPRVVSAAGARITTEQLLPADWRQSDWARGISAIRQSPPHICLYMGIEGDIAAAGGTPGNQWFMETWDMEQRDWDVRDPGSVAPALYMSFPSLKDPRHDPGPKQLHTAEVVTFVPWEVFTPWKDTRRGLRTKEYMEFKKGIEDRLLAQLRRHIPRILDITKYHELSTPLSTVHFARSVQGAIYGLEATPERFASPHLRTRTPIAGLYLAGGDVTTLGVTGALVGGVLAAATIEPRVFAQILGPRKGISVAPAKLRTHDVASPEKQYST